MRIFLGVAAGVFFGLLAFVVFIGYSLRLAEEDAQMQFAANMARTKAAKPVTLVTSPPVAHQPPPDLSLHTNEQCLGGYVVLHTSVGNIPQYSQVANRGHLLTCKDGRLLSPR